MSLARDKIAEELNLVHPNSFALCLRGFPNQFLFPLLVA
jgi:hypothetical protein